MSRTRSARSQPLVEHPARAATTAGSLLVRIGRAGAASLGVLAAFALVVLALSLTVLPKAVGGHTLTVLSGSMRPSLPVGSVLVDRPTPIGTLRVGEVITYATTDPGTGRAVLVTHRITAIASTPNGRVFTTKGDANRTVDSRPVLASQVRGTLWFGVPYLGRIRNFLLNGAGLVMLGSGITLLLAIAVLRRALRSSATAADPEALSVAPAQPDASELRTASHQ